MGMEGWEILLKPIGTHNITTAASYMDTTIIFGCHWLLNIAFSKGLICGHIANYHNAPILSPVCFFNVIMATTR